MNASDETFSAGSNPPLSGGCGSEVSGALSLRARLVLLLAAYGLFAVLAVSATIYGVKWQIDGAVSKFEHTLDVGLQIESMRLQLREQLLSLRAMADAGEAASGAALQALPRDELMTRLGQLVEYAPSDSDRQLRDRLAEAVGALDEQLRRLESLWAKDQRPEARRLVHESIAAATMPALDALLREAKSALDGERNAAVAEIGATSWHIFLLSAGVAGLAAVLVLGGASLIRRWLLVPIGTLGEATRIFGSGDLNHRVSLTRRDELGELGEALNRMARSLVEAQQELRASEQKHRALFENLRDAVVLCDEQGIVVECHDGETDLLGASQREPVGQAVLEVWPQWRAASAHWDRIIHDVMDRGRRFRAVDVALGGSGNDREVFADFLAYGVDQGGSRLAAIVVRDVSERHELQRRIRRAETMEAVGTFAGGLAHDLNNLLTSVIGTLTMVASRVQESQLADRMRAALDACWQAAGLSRKLLNFAVGSPSAPEVFDVREAVGLIQGSMDPSFFEGIELDASFPEPFAVRMDRDQFTQIVLNLLRNARDAMTEGGRLILRLYRASAEELAEAKTDRPHLVLVVRDTGPGIDPKVRTRIFEPFFTTKSRATRRGRGLGLAIVYSAVNAAGGFIRVESRPGQGTTFRVYLPLADAFPAPFVPFKRDAPVAENPARQGRIVIVEQDELTREAWLHALRERGLTVEATGSAKELEAWERANEPDGIALAVVEVDGRNGDDFTHLRGLVAREPSLRVILTTSGQAQPIPPDLAVHVRAQLLKPFSPAELVHAVAAALSPSPSGDAPQFPLRGDEPVGVPPKAGR